MKIRGFEIVKDEHRKFKEEIKLPTRGSKFSAGYDFYSNQDEVLRPYESKVFWTDIKAYMLPGEVLEIYIRSSIAIKKELSLKNFVGIIDMDFYSNETTDGNIGICLKNNSNDFVTIQKGERIAQGIFKNFLEADNGNTEEERKGGIGSTTIMEIKILGTGCSKCNTLVNMTKQAISELNINAKVEKEEDIVKIMSYGVLQTPGLVINGKLVLSGRVPDNKELKDILMK